MTRAVHIEIVDSLRSSAFNNAVLRFTIIRGKVKIFRSERGTNCLRATDELQLDTIRVENDFMKTIQERNGSSILQIRHISVELGRE